MTSQQPTPLWKRWWVWCIVCLALVGVVVGELYAATAGIGFLIAVAGNTFQTDKVFVGVVIVAFAGLVFTAIFNRIEAHFQSWKPKNN